MKRHFAKIKAAAVLFMLCCPVFCLFAQVNPRFLQPENTPLFHNPGFTGTEAKGRLAIAGNITTLHGFGYDNRWYASWDQYMPKLRGGIGGAVHFHSFGRFKTAKVQGTYAAKVKLWKGKATVSPGLRVGILHRRGNLNHGFIIPEGTVASWYAVDLSPGILVYGKRYYAGVGIEHWRAEKMIFASRNRNYVDAFSEFGTRWNVQAGYTFQPRNRDDWSVSVDGLATIRTVYRNAGPRWFRQLAFSGRYRWAELGIGWNNLGQTLLTAGFRKPSFKVAYALGLPARGGGGFLGPHELSLGFFFPQKHPTNGSPERPSLIW